MSNPSDPVAEAVSSRASRPAVQLLLAGVTPTHWRAGAMLGGIGLAGALATSLVTVLLLLAGVYTVPDLPEDGPDILGTWFFWLFQLVGMGFLSPLGGEFATDAGTLGALGLSTSAYLAPLVVPVATVTAILTVGRRVHRDLALPRGSVRAVVAATAGLTLAAAVLLLVAVFPVSFDVDETTSLSLRAVSVWGFLVAGVVGAGAAYVRLGPPGERIVPTAWRQAAREVVEHLGGLALLGGAALTISLGASLDEGAAFVYLAIPILLPLLGLAGLAVASLSAITVSGTVGSILGDGASSDAFTMFSSGLPAWVRICVSMVTILAVVVAGIRWRARRGPITSTGTDWAALPLTYGAFGLLTMAFGSLSVDVASGELGGFAGVVGPAPWTFLVLAALGLLVDIVARYAALPVLRVLPAGLGTALVGRVGERRLSLDEPAPVVAPAATSEPSVAEPATAAASAPEAPPTPAPTVDVAAATDRPLSRRAKRAWLATGIGVAGIVVLAVAGTVVHNQLAATTYGPQAEVEAYLQAVVDGDASSAVELLDPNVTSAERVLLADEIYAAAQGRPTAFEILDSTVAGDHAEVSATLTMDTKAHPVTFSLATSGRQAIVFDDWRIVEGPQQTVTVGYVGGVTQVNGVDVDLSKVSMLPEGGEQTAVPVLPGEYTFSAPDGTTYLTYGDDVSVLATPGAGSDPDMVGSEVDPTLVHFEQSWTPQAGTDAIAAVKKHVGTCMTSDQFEPEGCPTTLDLLDWGYAVTGIDRSWQAEPGYTFDDGMAEDSIDGPAVIITGGDLTIDYRSRWDEEDTWEKDSDSQTSVFGGDWSSTRVPVSLDDDGKLVLDYSDL